MIHIHRQLQTKPISSMKDSTQTISHVVWAMVLYFASALDIAITICFLLFQATRFPPRNTQYLVLELLQMAVWHTCSIWIRKGLNCGDAIDDDDGDQFEIGEWRSWWWLNWDYSVVVNQCKYFASARRTVAMLRPPARRLSISPGLVLWL